MLPTTVESSGTGMAEPTAVDADLGAGDERAVVGHQHGDHPGGSPGVRARIALADPEAGCTPAPACTPPGPETDFGINLVR
ncbi:hypothetical protein JHV675_54270 [Mycobacterium avium subsp. hominissuis]